jgi:hypothetical protein
MTAARVRRTLPCAGTAIALALLPRPAPALDKQGSAHGGNVHGGGSGFALAGSAIAGISIFNPSYPARPDNTGLTLMRYALHLDMDLVGRLLSIPIDVNMFTDKQQPGAAKLRPSELDIIAGVTSTFSVGPGALELGARFEHDRPIDGKEQMPITSTYGDARARYLFSLAAMDGRVSRTLRGGDVSGWATLGWFFYNPTYFARPDNTGRALFRYAFHLEISLWNGQLAAALDQTYFTDREASNVLRPSELDLTPEIIVRLRGWEFHLAYERDMPLDGPGLVFHYVYFIAARSFSLID